MALGRYPDLSLKESREKRDEAREQLEQGIDSNSLCDVRSDEGYTFSDGSERKLDDLVSKAGISIDHRAIGRFGFDG